jgi:hypothetical protein
MRAQLKWGVVSVAVAWALAGHSAEYQKTDLGEFLKDFKANTSKVMDQLPPKTGEKPIFFGDEERAENEFVEKKDKVRQGFVKLEGRAGFASNDRAENLVDNGYKAIGNLSEMDKASLHQASLGETPWSDDYWAIAKGVLGARYADPEKSGSLDWQVQFDFVQEKPAAAYIEAGAIDYLSPSEKYDLLVGDANFTLTNKMWAEGKYYQDNFGKVEGWMGICHGWAPAAYMLERPTAPATVTSADGKHEIKFFPSDIKALGSLLWAKTNTPSRFIGGRCNEKNPRRDEATGRIIDQQCFDTNPGTWHKAVVNQIGVSKRSFVIDATYDYEVWNQPVYSYSYRYFNVETGETSKEWQKSSIALADFAKDKFKQFRSARTAKVVGVEMRLTYVVETHPGQRDYDNSSIDATNSVTYRYDLELDEEGNIIGGEWYSNAHPDFLWTPAPETRAVSAYEAYAQEQWSGKAVPASYTRAGMLSSRMGQPLATIVEGLIERARTQE